MEKNVLIKVTGKNPESKALTVNIDGYDSILKAKVMPDGTYWVYGTETNDLNDKKVDPSIFSQDIVIHDAVLVEYDHTVFIGKKVNGVIYEAFTGIECKAYIDVYDKMFSFPTPIIDAEAIANPDDYYVTEFGATKKSEMHLVKFLCTCCHKAHIQADESDIKRVCKTCYSEFEVCPICGKSHHKSEFTDVVATEGTKHICKECAGKVKPCKFCGVKSFASQKAFLNSTDVVCPHCVDKIYSKTINDYSFKPYPIMVGKEPLKFGFELEYEVKGDKTIAAEKVVRGTNKNIANFVYAKSDGSINNGFELVSQPFSIDFLKSELGTKTFSDMFRAINHYCESKEDGHNNIGFHVHMSKSAFSKTQIMKYILIINSFKKWFINISRRGEENSYARFCKFSPKDLTKIVHGEKHIDRHSAINCGEYTLEARLFASTRDITTFKATIELLHAIFEFISVTRAKMCTAQNLNTFLMRKKAMYPYAYKAFYVREAKDIDAAKRKLERLTKQMALIEAIGTRG